MTLEKLLQERRIYRQKIASADILAVIARAERDIDSAQYMLERDPDWAFSIAYNSVLQASRALMLSLGFRPSSHEGHKNTFAFLRAVAEEDQRTLRTTPRSRARHWSNATRGACLPRMGSLRTSTSSI